MLECPSCGRLHPEVAGAPTQVCPHCGHEHVLGAAAPAPGLHADPVGALQHAWHLARRSYWVLLLLWLPLLALDLATTFATGAYERAQGLPSDPNLMTTGEQMRWLGVVLPLSLVASSVRLALWALVAAFVLDRALGGDRLARWRHLLPVALIAGAVLTLAFVAGFIMLIVGFFIVLHWFLYVPAFLADGVRGVAGAFEASRRFARERRTYGFTALVVLVGGLSLAGQFAVLALPAGADVVSALVAWLLGPVAPLLAASYLAVTKAAPPAPRADVPSAAPERASTKCPRCGALIPYTPSAGGTSTDVACPSCGYAGRVL